MATNMSINLTDFKNQIADVARPNRFWISFRSPNGANYGGGGGFAGAWNDYPMSFACKSSQLPGRTIGQILLGWQGMQAKIAGDPTVDDISFSFLNTADWAIRNFFEAWMQFIANMNTNDRTAHAQYKSECVLTQLGPLANSPPLAVYILEGAYPQSMDAVELSMDSNDTPQEINFTLTYDTFRRDDGTTIYGR
jgi:hypothetical protein